jgi:hypothetical protein
MKTYSPSSLRTVLLSALALGAFAASAFAGPGPQHWNKAPAPAAKASATATSDGKCTGCKTATKWVVSDRGPAGKGISGASVAGKSHTCTGCAGQVVTEKNKVNDTMTHGEACAPMLCCK